jgi:hypothetical protein
MIVDWHYGRARACAGVRGRRGRRRRCGLRIRTPRGHGAGGRGASGAGGSDGADAVGCTYGRSEGAARAGAGCTGTQTVLSAQAPHTARRTQHAQGAWAANDACCTAKAIAIQQHMLKTKVHKTTNSRILYCIMLCFKIIYFLIFHNPISNFS